MPTGAASLLFKKIDLDLKKNSKNNSNNNTNNNVIEQFLY